MRNLMEKKTTRPIRPKQAVKKKLGEAGAGAGEEAKLAAIAISLNVRLRSADMPPTMQEFALRYARSLLDSCSHRPNPSLLARCLKKEFDGMYGPAWHCVVGKSFGSFVTHSPGGFLYFSIGSDLCFLLFKTEVHLVNEVD
ncbi:dynein light chain 1, cytoplasmic-like [Diospyros lotus]|uniref:dynein light chain 1, cytoplasmic-like n=1 Tax=Diospyros lotus TaxID=55363 RepID=UPI00225648C4|nr:dynein light chain 1, cytoplasmic-like [Diospyros lotus]